MKNNINLEYGLSIYYFIEKKEYYENLSKEIDIEMNLPQEKKLLVKSYLNKQSIPAYREFSEALKNKRILKIFYETAIKNLKNDDKIEIIKNGLILNNSMILFYLIKGNRPENEYLNNNSNIESINDVQNDKDNYNAKIYNSNSTKYEGTITNLKYSLTAVESIVNFYFKQLNLIQLPDLVFNLTYENLDNNDDINLYSQYDGCYLYEGKECIYFENLKFFVPINTENRFIILKDNNIDSLGTNTTKYNYQIFNNTLIFIEVKTNFPSENDSNQYQKLESFIQKMLKKAKLFLTIYLKIFKNKKIENIQFILFYNNNRLSEYKDTINNYINKYKSEFPEEITKYNIYLDILHIFPSIGNISLNLINDKFNQLEKDYEKSKDKIKILENENKKAFEKIKYLEEDNIKSREQIQKMEEENKKGKEQMQKLEEENKKGKEQMNELEAKIIKMEEFINKLQMDSIDDKNKENKKQEDKKELPIVENKTNVDTIKEKIKIFDNKEKENQVGQITKNEEKQNQIIIQDKNYRYIHFKLVNNKQLSYYDNLYLKVYEECKNAVKDKDNFTLIKYQKYHAGINNKEITDAFHSVIEKFDEKERNDFFMHYSFSRCLRCPI